MTWGINDAAYMDWAYYGHYEGMPDDPTSPKGTGLSLQVGGQTIASPSGSLMMSGNENAYKGQGYGTASGLNAPFSVGTITNNVPGSPVPFNVTLTLANTNRAVINVDPLSPATDITSLPWLALPNFDKATLDVTDSTGKTLYSGTISTLTLVPEPSSVAAWIVLAASGWAAWRRRVTLASCPTVLPVGGDAGEQATCAT
jgi:hypothetical protein